MSFFLVQVLLGSVDVDDDDDVLRKDGVCSMEENEYKINVCTS